MLLTLQVLVFGGGIETGAGLLWGEGVVTHDEGTGILSLQVVEKTEEGSLLGGSSGVFGVAFDVESTFVADADAVGVVTYTMGSHRILGTTRLNGAVAEDDVVVAYAVPASGTVPAVYLGGGGGLVRAHCRAVNDDEGDGTHNKGALRN